MKKIYLTSLFLAISLAIFAQWSVTFDDREADQSGLWTLNKKIGESITIAGTMPTKGLTAAWIDIIIVDMDNWTTVDEITLRNINTSGTFNETILIPPTAESTIDFTKNSYQYIARVIAEYGGNSWQNRIAALNVLPASGNPGKISIGFNNLNQKMHHNQSLPLTRQKPGSKISVQYEYSENHYSKNPTKIGIKLMEVNASWATIGDPILEEFKEVKDGQLKGEITLAIPEDIKPNSELPITDFYIVQALVYYGKVPLYSIILLDIE